MKKIWFIALLFFSLLNWQCRRQAEEAGSTTQQPNIIFLLADDMRYDAPGYTGNKLAITPSLDKLAAEGTNFKNTYVTSSICAISRASILTGQYARRHGINNFEKSLPSWAQRFTYPSVLRDHGYYTGFIGKYGVGTEQPADMFDYWKGFPGHGVYFYKDANGNLVHETALMGQQAKEFISTRDKAKPFCLSISFKAPHSEDGVTDNNGFRPDPYFNNWYTNVQFPHPETYADSFYRKFSPLWRKSPDKIENEGRVRWQMRFSLDKFQTTYRAIYRLVSGIDKTVGELRAFLKANNLDRNTIIVFTSDNGYYMGEHGLEGKWYGHEESIRVPLVIYDPRMPAQRKVVSEMALNIDLAPTILTWAGVELPHRMQGMPLQPLLSGSSANWRNEFFYEHLYDAGRSHYMPKTVGVVTPTWKYMRYFSDNSSSQHALFQELYNDAADPHETTNRAFDPAQKEMVREFKQKVAQYENQLK